MQAAKYVERRDRVATGAARPASKLGFPNGNKESQTYRVKQASEPVRETKRTKKRPNKGEVDDRLLEKCVTELAER